MVQVTYVESSGAAHAVDVPEGWSLMEGAVRNGVPGIVADCGGSCACGTCRVYLDGAWREQLGPPSDVEAATLELFEDDTPGKRLACQIPITPALDGLTVTMPERQY